MGLDLTKLNALGTKKTGYNEFKEEERVNIPNEIKTPNIPRKLQNKADNVKKQIEMSNQVLKEYQENKRKCTMLLTEIEKGVNTGEDIQLLFLKAIQIIGLMTSERTLYTRIERKLYDATN